MVMAKQDTGNILRFQHIFGWATSTSTWSLDSSLSEFCRQIFLDVRGKVSQIVYMYLASKIFSVITTWSCNGAFGLYAFARAGCR